MSSGAPIDLDAVSHAMFGRLTRWRKDRIGGTAWHLNCELAEGDASLSPARTHKKLPRLGIMAKAAQTTH